MKKISQFIFIICCFIFNLTAKADTPAELILDSSQVNPLISLRNLETGTPLNNQQFQDDRKFVWQIREVLSEQTPLHNIAGLTQFRVPNSERCLYTIQNRIIAANCDPFDIGSLWQVIPTTLGGVQIKSLRTNQCLSAGNSYNDFRLATCQEDASKTVPIKLLWVLAPAAVNATLVPSE